MSEMAQAVYFCVMGFLAEVPMTELFQHITRWRVANIAYVHLMFSTAAWSPTRPAVLQLALRLSVNSGARDLDFNSRLAARFVRQQRRALAALPFLLPVDTVTAQVRQLVRLHRVERAVLAGLLRMHPQLLQDADVLRDAAASRVVEDESSSSSDDEP